MAVRNVILKIKLNRPFEINKLNQEYIGQISYALYDTRNSKKVGIIKKTKAVFVISGSSRFTNTDTMRMNVPSNEGGTNNVKIKWSVNSDTPEYIKTYFGLTERVIAQSTNNNDLEIRQTVRDEELNKAIKNYVKKYIM